MKRVVAVFCLMFATSAAYASGRLTLQGVHGQWWSPMWAAIWTGALGGGFGGLFGILGAVAGVLACRGKARRFVLGMWTTFVGISAIALAAGIIALVVRQPFWVHYPLLLIGSIGTVVGGCLLPQVRRTYDQAELRRMEMQDATSLRCE